MDIIQHGGKVEGDHSFEELKGEQKLVCMLHCVMVGVAVTVCYFDHVCWVHLQVLYMGNNLVKDWGEFMKLVSVYVVRWLVVLEWCSEVLHCGGDVHACVYLCLCRPSCPTWKNYCLLVGASAAQLYSVLLGEVVWSCFY